LSGVEFREFFCGGFMTEMSRNMGFMIDLDTADELEQLILTDQQNKFVSQAIANELSRHRRKMVVTEMLEDCVGMPIIARGKLQSDLAEDRKRG
jgi:hypothetical protein